MHTAASVNAAPGHDPEDGELGPPAQMCLTLPHLAIQQHIGQVVAAKRLGDVVAPAPEGVTVARWT